MSLTKSARQYHWSPFGYRASNALWSIGYGIGWTPCSSGSGQRVEQRLHVARRGRLVARVAPDDAAHLAQVDLRRERVAGRHRRVGEEAVELARGGGEELAVRRQHLGAAARPARTSGRRSPCSTSWRRNSNAVTTPKLPPPPRSAQNRSGCSSLLACTSSPLASTTSARQQVVDRQAVLAGQVAEAAAEREPADAGRADDPARGGEPVLVGGAVDLAPRAAAADADGAGARVDVDPADRGEVDHDAVVDRAEPGAVVPAAADREREARLAGVRRCSRATSSAPAPARSSAGRRSIIAL